MERGPARVVPHRAHGQGARRQGPEETGKPLVDLVQDKAGQKGTGKWTAELSLDLGVPIPTITAAIDARVLSRMKDRARRRRASAPRRRRREPAPTRSSAMLAAIARRAPRGQDLLVRAGHAAHPRRPRRVQLGHLHEGDGAHLEGRLHHPRAAARQHHARLRARARPRRTCCSTRTSRGACPTAQASWRQALGVAQTLGIPTPSFSARLAYFDSYRTARLPQNLTQAQRDAFGAHTYERTDHPDGARAHRVARRGMRLRLARRSHEREAAARASTRASDDVADGGVSRGRLRRARARKTRGCYNTAWFCALSAGRWRCMGWRCWCWRWPGRICDRGTTTRPRRTPGSPRRARWPRPIPTSRGASRRPSSSCARRPMSRSTWPIRARRRRRPTSIRRRARRPLRRDMARARRRSSPSAPMP